MIRFHPCHFSIGGLGDSFSAGRKRAQGEKGDSAHGVAIHKIPLTKFLASQRSGVKVCSGALKTALKRFATNLTSHSGGLPFP
jgi:hypothetical protein